MRENLHSKIFILLFVATTTLFGALSDKSAMVYYGNHVSYSMVGVHDYIIVEPKHVNAHSHGFKLYKDKMYAYVSIGEIDKTTDAYAKIDKSWVIAKNKAWKSEVLDIKNSDYQQFLFKELIEPRMKQGFKNFFFDTLDSYQLASKTKEEREANEAALAAFINLFHKLYPESKLILNRGFEIIDRVHDSIEAVLFESYYRGIGGEKLGYKEVSDSDREWLDVHIKKIRSYGVNVISVEYLEPREMDKAKEVIDKIKAKGMIPYVSNRELNLYGQSSKKAVKREVFTLIDDKIGDIIFSGAHQYGALVLEYMGYVQELYDVDRGLPTMDEMMRYAGVIIWLGDYYKSPEKLIKWVSDLNKAGVRVVFANSFGMDPNSEILKPLEISVSKGMKQKSKIKVQSGMMGYEIAPSFSISSMQINSKNIEPLLTYEFMDATTSTPAAITEWGGYAVGEAFIANINNENIWVINPFEFFKKALRLQMLIVPDVTTENGKRLLFSHVDGDGIMNRVEGESERFSGEVILEEVLKKYKIPHSVSVIGAEIDKNGLYPELSEKLQSIAKEFYKLDNVEGATHTFTHPFIWAKIKNDSLDEKYRLKPKGYQFSLKHELSDSLEFINKELSPPMKKNSDVVFWSGDCSPRVNALDYVYSHDILNINRGDTTITRSSPWMSTIAPLGIKRGDYYQVYTGAQNENVFTNDWLGPFWGFKRVVQTFELTNSPRRFKPIDVYYHLYSGSKKASREALAYVFDWAVKQDVMPIFTSEYIPKVMDYYEVSMAQDGEDWLVEGMRDLRTLRVEERDASVDFNKSKSTIGVKHFENHAYLSLDASERHFLTLDNNDSHEKRSHMISANAKITDYLNEENHQRITFEGHVDLKLDFYLAPECKLESSPKAKSQSKDGETLSLSYKKGVTKAVIEISCD